MLDRLGAVLGVAVWRDAEFANARIVVHQLLEKDKVKTHSVKLPHLPNRADSV